MAVGKVVTQYIQLEFRLVWSFVWYKLKQLTGKDQQVAQDSKSYGKIVAKNCLHTSPYGQRRKRRTIQGSQGTIRSYTYVCEPACVRNKNKILQSIRLWKAGSPLVSSYESISSFPRPSSSSVV